MHVGSVHAVGGLRLAPLVRHGVTISLHRGGNTVRDRVVKKVLIEIWKVGCRRRPSWCVSPFDVVPLGWFQAEQRVGQFWVQDESVHHHSYLAFGIR